MMYKNYPYLINSIVDTENIITAKKSFLTKLEQSSIQYQYVKITLLDWYENPLKEIQGNATGGSITQDSSSSVRRSCSLTVSLATLDYEVDELKMDFSINKKIYIELGVQNTTNEYSEFPIVWFPQGIFFINNCSISSNPTSCITMSLTLHDKMAKLNGLVGGVFSASVDLDVSYGTNAVTGETLEEKILIYDLIQELVNHWGGEPLENIVIEDVDLKIKRVIKWIGDNPCYLRQIYDEEQQYWYYDFKRYEEYIALPPSERAEYTEYVSQTDIGYTWEDFVYSDTLTMNAGQTVTAALDKIKSYLGNYEYFYDSFGIFHFRQIKNYSDTSRGSFLLSDMNEKDYLVENSDSGTLYDFKDNLNILSLSVNPQYSNVKNDFIVLGLRKNTTTDTSYMIMYHLAIDNKPSTYNTYKNFIVYNDSELGTSPAAFPIVVSDLPDIGDTDTIYKLETVKASFEEHKLVVKNMRFSSSDNNVIIDKDFFTLLPHTVSMKKGDLDGYYQWKLQDWYLLDIKADYFLEPYESSDWRTDLYLQALMNSTTGLDNSWYAEDTKLYDGTYYWRDSNQKISFSNNDFYDEELKSYWHTVYDIANNKFFDNAEYNSNYYLDFIDPLESDLGRYSISNIGRRTNVTNNESINCLFIPQIPDVIFLNGDEDDIESQKLNCINKGYSFAEIDDIFYDDIATGGESNPAFAQIQDDLYKYTNYQKAITITTRPIYGLETNSYISVSERNTKTNGKFLIKNISCPLGNGTMTISANEVFNKI